jgi:hypothetical protein
MSKGADEHADSAGVLTVEVGRESQYTYDRCGRTAVTTAGFVYRDGDAYAIYHSTLHRHDAVSGADIAIGIGTWETDSAVAEVSAFLAAWPEGDEIKFGFVDPASSVWANTRLLQNQLTADEARTSASRGDLLRVAEGVVRQDLAVARHLGAS